MASGGGGATPSGMQRDSALRRHLQHQVLHKSWPSVVSSSSLSGRGVDVGVSASVSVWLQDVRLMTDNECMHTLQSKAVAKELSHLVAMAGRNTKDTVGALQLRAKVIASEYSRLCRKVEKGRLGRLAPSSLRLLCHTRALFADYSTSCSAAVKPQTKRLETKVLVTCERICKESQRLEVSKHESSAFKCLQEVLHQFHASFFHLVDLITAHELRVIVDAIDEPFNQYCLKTAVANLASLGLNSEHVCRLIAKVGGVRSLLSVCVEPKYRQFRAAALRALATVCCVIDAIGELEKAGGIEIIADILCDAATTEREKSEAAGVIAQITSPWIDDNQHIRGLSESIEQLITALTELARRTCSDEVFLLASAALANITFLDSRACECLRRAGTTDVLVRVCREKVFTDCVFIKDQVSTVLANLAAFPECRASVLQPGGLVLLLCFLQVRPSLVQRDAEIAACERVQQKSAIALSRLCTDAVVARQVMDVQGAERLVRLCKDEKERNQSDAVLVACLAALRKIASACGIDEFKGLDATELVEPRLLDSFLIYSSRQESYV